MREAINKNITQMICHLKFKQYKQSISRAKVILKAVV